MCCNNIVVGRQILKIKENKLRRAKGMFNVKLIILKVINIFTVGFLHGDCAMLIFDIRMEAWRLHSPVTK